jgi:hypothetical protein
MFLFLKTELNLEPLTSKLSSVFSSAGPQDVVRTASGDGTFVAHLIPPNIGKVVLCENAGAARLEKWADWPCYLRVEALPALSRGQEEMAWTQLKMNGGFLSASKTATDVLAVKSLASGRQRSLTA